MLRSMGASTVRARRVDVRRGARLLAWVSALLALALVAGCSSPEEKAIQHLDRGREFLAEGDVQAASIEFNNAVRQDPENADVHLELGNLALRDARTKDALFHLREAHRIAPEDADVGISLALLLRLEDPDEARLVMDGVLEREPDNGLAHAASSQVHQSQGDITAGHAAALRAVELAADRPSLQWQLGLSAQAMVFRARTLRQPVEDELYETGRDAFDAFLALGGEPAWKAHLEKARLLASWPGHPEEALAAARLAIETVRSEDDDGSRVQVAEKVSTLARSLRDKRTYADALEILIDLNPSDLVAWKNLAELRQASGGSAEEVYRSMLARRADDSEAHVLYAGFLARTLGLRAALGYFDEQIAAGVHPARMLSAKRNLELSTGLVVQARTTLRRMKDEHPDSPWTVIEQSQDGLQRGEVKRSIERLEALVQEHEIPEAFELLARAQLAVGNRTAAERAAVSAIRAAKRFDPKAERVLAQVMFETGKFEMALASLERLDDRLPLTPDEQLLLAKTHYALDQREDGLEILLERLTADPMDADVIVEYARQEATNPLQRDRVEAVASAALVRDPTNSVLLTLLVNSDLELGRQGVALARLEGLDLAHHPPEVALLRARLRTDQQDLEGAIVDANHAFVRNPELPKLVDLLVALHATHGSLETASEQLRKRIERWKSKRSRNPELPIERAAWNQILLSRYLTALGRQDEAIEVLTDSIRDRDANLETNLELAFLLARSGVDLDRAEYLALVVVKLDGSDPHAHDTLGFVHLRKADYEAALASFQQAITVASAPDPRFYFHEYMALKELGRDAEALTSLENLLALDPRYPGASALHEQLRESLEAVGATEIPATES